VNRTALLTATLPFLLLGLSSAACSSSATSGAPTHDISKNVSALVPMRSCVDVDAHVKSVAIADMNRRLDAAKDSFLKNGGACYASGEGDLAGASGTGAGGSSTGGPVPGAATGGSTKGASQVSTTNNQVAGVDEADFIKNDDKYVYLVTNGAFRVVDAWPAAQAHEIAKLPIDGQVKKLFVEGDRALVYTAIQRPARTTGGSGTSPGYPGGYPVPDGGSSECSYGYDCQITGDGTATKIVELDIRDRSKPVLVREVTLTGSLIAARRIGDAVHTVVSTPDVQFPSVSDWPQGLTNCGQTTDTATADRLFEELRQKNIDAINATDVLSQLPTVKDSLGLTPGDACGGYYGSKLTDGGAFLTVASLDMAHEGPVSSSTIVSRPGTVYASEDALYVSVRHDSYAYAGYAGDYSDQKELSTIHKFFVGDRPDITAYAASGVVEGHVVDQFALDQWSNTLRVATSTGRDPDPEVHSQITTLTQVGAELVTAGRVTDIAPHEDIRSVRFEGARGFITTFKKTDPLFTFDLANPAAPTMLGALQIPGFSTYMHMMDENHLLTIGYDADDQGDFAWFAGVIVQIFDVTDPRNPALTSKVTIGTRGSSSEALANHLAFNYFAPKGVLALPMTICEGGSGGSYGTNMTFNGLIVYDVSTTAGIKEHGRVAHPNASSSSSSSYDNSFCSNWWANAGTEVKRSVFMDDFVYSVSPSRIKIENLGNMGTDVAEVKLDD
jgi:hypothetical protein